MPYPSTIQLIRAVNWVKSIATFRFIRPHYRNRDGNLLTQFCLTHGLKIVKSKSSFFELLLQLKLLFIRVNIHSSDFVDFLTHGTELHFGNYSNFCSFCDRCVKVFVNKPLTSVSNLKYSLYFRNCKHCTDFT